MGPNARSIYSNKLRLWGEHKPLGPDALIKVETSRETKQLKIGPKFERIGLNARGTILSM